LKKALGIATPLQQAEQTLLILRRLRLVDRGLEFSRNEKEVFIPLSTGASSEDIEKIKERCPDVRIQEANFVELKTRPRNLLESVRGKIPEPLLSSVPRSCDIIGDIGIIELPEDLIQFSAIIGRGVLEVNPHFRLVLRKSSEVTGTFRTRKYQTIAGSGNTETFCREYSCVFHLDIAKVYFNPRLSHERMRVAGQAKPHETVVDMFAGVGPYSILIAKMQPTSRVTAIDINPEAFRYLKENILTNGVADCVVPILDDARQVTSRTLQGTASRVIMNLPSEARSFLDAAVQVAKRDGGIIHYYTFASRSDDLSTIEESVRAIVESAGREVHSVPFRKIIREIAPNRVQVAVDVQLK